MTLECAREGLETNMTVLSDNPEFARKIGLIVERWTFIERALRDFVSHITGCSFGHAVAILYSLPSITSKLDVTQALVMTMPEHKHKGELLDLLDAIRKRGLVRNKIVHGNYIGQGDKFGYAVALLTPRGKEPYDSSPLPDVLNKHLENLDDLMKRIEPFVHEQPNAPGRLPVQWRPANAGSGVESSPRMVSQKRSRGRARR